MPCRTSALLLTCAAALSACSDSTSAEFGTVLTPDIGPTLTLAGPSALGGTAVSRIRDAVEGSPLAIVVSQVGFDPGERSCVSGPGILQQTCTFPWGSLTVGFTIGGLDSLGRRTEVTLSGTIPEAPLLPARLVARKSSFWNSTSGVAESARPTYRSIETGTSAVVGDPGRTTADTGTVDVRLVGGLGLGSSVPLLVGTSRRVVWSRVPGQSATFWRETTTYDSTRLIKSVIETPAGTKRCTIDIAVFTRLAQVCE